MTKTYEAELGVWATVHEDKPISLEAAKLLGVAFTWGAGTQAFKFVPTDDGYEAHMRWIVNAYAAEYGWRYADSGEVLEYDLTHDTDYDDEPYELHLVTFSDEDGVTAPAGFILE